MKVLFVQVLVTLAVLKSAFAVYCYDCSSFIDSRCGESFKPYPKAIVNCDDQPFELNGVSFNATFCRKVTQTGREQPSISARKVVQRIFLVYGQTRVMRSCGYIPSEKKRNRCMKVSFTEATESFYCDCEEDFCNGFSGTSRLSLRVATFIGLAFVLKIVQ